MKRFGTLFTMLALAAALVLPSACHNTARGIRADTHRALDKTGQKLERTGEKIDRR